MLQYGAVVIAPFGHYGCTYLAEAHTVAPALAVETYAPILEDGFEIGALQVGTREYSPDFQFLSYCKMSFGALDQKLLHTSRRTLLESGKGLEPAYVTSGFAFYETGQLFQCVLFVPAIGAEAFKVIVIEQLRKQFPVFDKTERLPCRVLTVPA